MGKFPAFLYRSKSNIIALISPDGFCCKKNPKLGLSAMWSSSNGNCGVTELLSVEVALPEFLPNLPAEFNRTELLPKCETRIGKRTWCYRKIISIRVVRCDLTRAWCWCLSVFSNSCTCREMFCYWRTDFILLHLMLCNSCYDLHYTLALPKTKLHTPILCLTWSQHIVNMCHPTHCAI